MSVLKPKPEFWTMMYYVHIIVLEDIVSGWYTNQKPQMRKEAKNISGIDNSIFGRMIHDKRCWYDWPFQRNWQTSKWVVTVFFGKNVFYYNTLNIPLRKPRKEWDTRLEIQRFVLRRFQEKWIIHTVKMIVLVHIFQRILMSLMIWNQDQKPNNLVPLRVFCELPTRIIF